MLKVFRGFYDVEVDKVLHVEVYVEVEVGCRSDGETDAGGSLGYYFILRIEKQVWDRKRVPTCTLCWHLAWLSHGLV